MIKNYISIIMLNILIIEESMFNTKSTIFLENSTVNLLLIFSLLVTTLYLISTKNPLKALLFLIILFILSSVILILFGCQFVAINLIIIYLGAILVLLIFVIMLSNSNITETFEIKGVYKSLILFGTIKQISFCLFLLNSVFVEKKKISLTWFEFSKNNLNEILNVATYLYNNQKLILIGAVLVLLLALIVSLFLTQSNNNQLKNL